MRISSLQRGLIGSSGDPLRVSTSGGCVSGGAAFNWSTAKKAEYRMETGALETDSSGNSNTLTAYGDPSAYGTSPPQGSYSCYYDGNDAHYIVDSSLPAGFPGKGNTGSQNFLIMGWWSPHMNQNSTIVTKYYATNYERQFEIANAWGTANNFKVLISSLGSSADVSFTFTPATYNGVDLTVDDWYHFGFWHDTTLDKWGIRVWDGSTVYNYSAAYSSGVWIDTTDPYVLPAFAIGARRSSGGTYSTYADGRIDQVVVYSWADGSNPTEKQILDKIDAVRGGTAP